MEIKPRRINVSHESMELINQQIEKYRRIGVPEHEIQKYRNSLIESHGVEIKDNKRLNDEQ